MRYLRFLLASTMVAYVATACLRPDRLYVDRFLMRMKFREWAVLQVCPSMYSTEIVVREERSGRILSTPHHPMRVFYEISEREPRCETYEIRVRYRSNFARERFRLCNDVLEPIRPTPRTSTASSDPSQP